MDAHQKMGILRRKAETRRANLRRWMEENHIRPTDVADRMGVGRSYVSLLFKRSFGENAARAMEQSLGMPDGYLDSDTHAPEFTEDWSTIDDLRSGMSGAIRRTDLEVGESGGIVEVARRVPPISISRDLLASRGVRALSNLAFVVQRGDAMAPYLSDSELALVDRGQTLTQEGLAYAVSFGNMLLVRRLRPALGGGLVLTCDNPRFGEERVAPEDADKVQILGRVIWRAG